MQHIPVNLSCNCNLFYFQFVLYTLNVLYVAYLVYPESLRITNSISHWLLKS